MKTTDLTSNAFPLSRLNAHLMFPLFTENRKSIPQSFSGKKLFKNVTRQIFNFILVS